MRACHRLVTGLALLFLSACAAVPPADTTTDEVTEPLSQPLAISELPCVGSSDPATSTISYPPGSLFREGAVLPSSKGLECLNVLADWLKARPDNRWQITLAGEAGLAFSPGALADKRQQLLQRYFQRQDLPVESWRWQSLTGPGPQLQFTVLRDAL